MAEQTEYIGQFDTLTCLVWIGVPCPISGPFFAFAFALFFVPRLELRGDVFVWGLRV